MAANEVRLTIKVGDDGSLDVVAKKADEAAKATNRLEKSTKKTTDARNRYHKGEKGVASAGANTTKNFSKMNQAMVGSSGLVGAYATLAANVFALTAAFGVLSRAAEVSTLEQGFTRLGNTVGRTSSLMASSLVEITGGAVSLDQAFRTAASGFSAGFSTDSMSRLAEIAKNASIALGRDLGDSLDRLIRGVAKLEPEILDELGIFVRLDDAVDAYASQLGVTSGALTETQRRQAFLNAALAQGEQKFASLGGEVDVNPYTQLAAAFQNLAQTVIESLNTVVLPLVQFLSQSTLGLIGVLVLFSSTVLKQMVPALTTLGGAAAKSAKKQEEAAKAGEVQAQKMIKTARMIVGKTTPLGDKTVFATLQKDIKAGKVDLQKLDDALGSLNRSENRRVSDLNARKVQNIKLAEEELQIVRDQKAAVEQLIAAEKRQLGPQKQSRRAGTASRVEAGLGAAIDGIAQKGAIEGFKSAQEELAKYNKKLAAVMHREGEYTKGLKGLNNVLKNAPFFFRAAGAGARLFGAALINAIPVIGQALFLIGLLAEPIINWVRNLDLASESQKKFDAITESLSGKLEQLTKTNSGLEDGYFGLALASKLASQEAVLTAENFNEAFMEAKKSAEELAKTNANIAAYGNNLKVAAGVMDEFAAATKEMGKEISQSEVDLIDVAFAKMGKALTEFGKALKSGVIEEFKALVGWVKETKEALESFVTSTWETFKTNFPKIAGAISGTAEVAAGVAEVLAAPVIGLAQGVVAAGEAIVETAGAVKEGAKEFTESGEGMVKVNRLIDGITSEYGKLLETGKGNPEFLSFIQKLEEEFGPDGIAGAIRKAAGDTEDFAAAQAFANMIIQRVTKGLQEQSAAVNNYQEGLKEAARKMTEFAAKGEAKDEFKLLADEVVKAQTQIENLANNLKEGVSLADVIEKDRTALEPIFKSFGLSIDQVKEKGTGAFQPLLDDFLEASKLSKTLKDDIVALKASLKDLKLEYDTKVAREQLRLLKQSIEQTGKAGQAVQFAGVDLNEDGKVESRLKEEFELRKKLNQDEANLKKELIEQEVALRKKILEIQLKMSGLDEEKAKEVQALITSLDDNVKAQQSVVDAEKDVKDIQNVNKFLNDQLALRQQILSTVKDEGQSMFDRLQAFGKISAIKDEAGNELNKFDTARTKLEGFRGLLSGTLEDLKALGPEGELIASIGESAFNVGQAWINAGESISKSVGKAGEGAAKTAAVLGVVSTTLSGINDILQSQSRARIAQIDKEIEAEKRRDGKSAQSLEKISALEKKKDKEKRKAFEINKKMQMAMVVVNTAMAISAAVAAGAQAAALSGGVTLPAWVGAFVGIVSVLGAAQLALIASTSYQGGGSIGSANSTPSSISAGNRKSSVDVAKSQSASGELGYFRGESGTGGPESFKRGFAGMKYRAEGGNTGIIVGEQGPELFVPSTPGRVVPNDDIGSSTQNISFSINTVDATGVEELLTAQRGNIIGMLREASNSYGQPFMEKVNTQIYNRQAGASRYGGP